MAKDFLSGGFYLSLLWRLSHIVRRSKSDIRPIHSSSHSSRSEFSASGRKTGYLEKRSRTHLPSSRLPCSIRPCSHVNIAAFFRAHRFPSDRSIGVDAERRVPCEVSGYMGTEGGDDSLGADDPVRLCTHLSSYVAS
jgi:hypothetical protein